MDVAIIGAGPSGLAAARALQRVGIRARGYEQSHGVGGLWDITNPRSTMYESAHLISSRATTEFTEFPMTTRADYPGHHTMAEYFTAYAETFNLTELFEFNTRVEALEQVPPDSGTPDPSAAGNGAPPRWRLRVANTVTGEQHSAVFDHVIVANGTLAEPNVPEFAGEFTGKWLHSSEYKSARQLADKRVLIIGAGNSGCDLAVDAVHHAASVDMSVRRGYYFVPRYVFGRPSDTFNQGRPLPRPIKQFVDKWLLRAFTGNPERFGFPKPQYKIYESHPIVNTMVLGHLGQGDLEIRANISHFAGPTAHFTDGTSGDYDLVVLATGYTLDYPFLAPEHLNWVDEAGERRAAPELFLNIFPPAFNGIAVMGMVEASGLGWQGRYEQAELIAAYLKADATSPRRSERFRARVTRAPWPDLTAGYRYLGLDRMSYYVNKDAYRGALADELAGIRAPLEGAVPQPGPAGPRNRAHAPRGGADER